MTGDHICGTCRFGYVDSLGEVTCANRECPRCGDWVGSGDTCKAWDGNCTYCSLAGAPLYGCPDCDWDEDEADDD